MSPPRYRQHIRTLIGGAAVHALTALMAAVGVLVWCHGPREFAGQWAELTLVAGGMTLAAFVSGFVLTRHILRPGQRLWERTEDLLTAACGGPAADHGGPHAVLDRLEALLIHVDARHLFPEVICGNRRMQAVMQRIRMLVPAEINALVSGESGTGKTLLAETIHRHGPHREGPLVRIDCTLRPVAGLAREVGSVPDGAAGEGSSGPSGALAQAQGGTLLLEEIAALPMNLQERLFTAVAGEASANGRSAVGLVATTSVDLSTQVAAGRFHRGLFEKLAHFRIELPPLRERIDDLLPLADHFRLGDHEGGFIETSALQALIGYDWPGNVKELKNVIAAAVARSSGGPVARGHLPAAIQAAGGLRPPAAGSQGPGAGIDEQLQTFEKQMIEEALQQTAGIQVRAAALLGINQRSLWHRIKKYGIDAAAFKKAGPSTA